MIRFKNNDNWLPFNFTESFSSTLQALNPYMGVKKKRNHRFELCFAPEGKTSQITGDYVSSPLHNVFLRSHLESNVIFFSSAKTFSLFCEVAFEKTLVLVFRAIRGHV